MVPYYYILLLLVIFIPLSKWCLPLQTAPLWSNHWNKELQQPLRSAVWGGTLPRLLLPLRETWKRLMQFWNNYIISGCIKNLVWAWGDVTKECVNGIWKKTLEVRLLVTSKDQRGGGYRHQHGCGWDDKHFNLGEEEDDTEEYLGVVPEESTNELFELEQRYIAEDEAGGKEEEEKERRKGRTPKKIHSKLFNQSFFRLQ